MILTESIAVEPRGRIQMKDLGIWDDKFIEPLREIVSDCQEYGSKVGIQINHAGRKAEVDEPVIGPSALKADDESPIPIEMTKQDIDTVTKAFGQAARRAEEIGFDFLELHGAHGYLISQFLCPDSNKRTDEYGKNRWLFLSDVLDEVRKFWPAEKPIFVRVSAHDYIENGNTPEIMADLLSNVKDKFDLVHVSSGGTVRSVKIPSYAGYQIKMAEIIKEKLNKPVASVGLIFDPHMAEEILMNNRADIITLGRGLLHDPYWPLHAAYKLSDDRVTWPEPYAAAMKRFIGK